MSSCLEDGLTDRIIGAAIAVHRELGPGFLESINEEALCLELAAMGLAFTRQTVVPIEYRSRCVGEHRLDLVVERLVVVELKAVRAFEDVHYAIVRSYLHASGATRGLLLNLSAPTLQIKRVGREYTPR